MASIENKVLYCDGGMNKHTKGYAWASVVDQNSVDKIGEYSSNEILSDFETLNVKLPKGYRYIIPVKFGKKGQNDESIDLKQENNSAELISMLIALRIATKIENNINIIYSDSSLLVDYWSKNKVSKKTKESMNPKKLKYIQEVSKLRTLFETNNGSIIKIAGKDNLADLGYHKDS